MVCKENVVSWFGNLSSYKRIDVMCTLLNMCLPFEIRYIGICVEDRGKRDYNDLRDTEHHANSVTELTELTAESVTEKRIRRKLVLYMALLQSCNYACAVVLYKNLANLDIQEVINLLNGTSSNQEDQALEELLLLYAMALNHPAFTYDQKNTFGNIFVKLQEEEARLNAVKSTALATNKSTQSCLPCAPNDRIVDAEIPSNCMVPPPMQTYHGDMQMRGNAIYTGIPPGLSMPPPGLCLPSPEQMSMGTGMGTQYVHVGFPTMNHIQPWAGQVLMSNQLMYHTGDVLAYPPSPLVSRQSSPSQSRSPSRNNSPSRRNSTIARTSSQVSQPVSNTLTTSTSSSTNQTNVASSSTSSLPPLPTAATNRNLPSQLPLLPPRSNPPPITSTASYTHHNSVEMSATQGPSLSSKQPPPPPRLRSSVSGDSLRETLGKEMPNFKGNLQNLSLDEIRRMSDEDLRDIGLTPNAVGQLRNIVRSQTSNGLSQLVGDKKMESLNNPSNLGDQMENEMGPGVDVSDVNMNAKSMPMQEHLPIPQHQGQATVPNMRRYPTMPPMDPSHMQMYTTPPPMYAAQNPPCYACLTVPFAGVQNRYSRCNAQHVYCLGQLQALRLDPESSRHCSQSSSSESTGSRSPPETPPAAPWVGGAEVSMPPVTDHLGSAPLHSVAPSHPPLPQPMPPPQERQRNRKSQTHVIRHKNQMVNGGGPSNVQHCMTFPAPPPHSQVAYLPHGHYPAMRPSAGVYSNFSPAAYARPAFPPTYQPNGEMMYPYHGLPGSGGTPSPPQNAMPPPPQPYMPPPPVVTYTPAVPPAKISCYNCGSNSHLATDCKDLTMEDLTKRVSSSSKFVAKDKTIWYKSVQGSHQTPSRNIIRQRAGPHRSTNMLSISETCKKFLTLEMVDIIVRCTNKKAHAVYEDYNSKHQEDDPRVWKDVSQREMYSVFAILICAGAHNSNTDHVPEMWKKASFSLYRATMGRSRFQAIMRFIRFDDHTTRRMRAANDKVAPISDIWNMLNSNLATFYKPTESLTIDEQLYPFRGRTKFTQYMPSKPAKYGIKVWWICDAENGYPLKGMIYTGKVGNTRDVNQGERVVKELAIAYKGSGRNISMDRFFTTLPLAKLLLTWNLTLVGTLKKNKAYIPQEMKPSKSRPILSTLFGFHEKVTICSYVPKKKIKP